MAVIAMLIWAGVGAPDVATAGVILLVSNPGLMVMTTVSGANTATKTGSIGFPTPRCMTTALPMSFRQAAAPTTGVPEAVAAVICPNSKVWVRGTRSIVGWLKVTAFSTPSIFVVFSIVTILITGVVSSMTRALLP